MTTFVLVLALSATAAPGAAPGAALGAAPAAPAHIAIAALEPAHDDAVRGALEGRGFVVEPRASAASLIAEAQTAGGACALDDAACWSKVGLYAGFERIVVAGAEALVLVDVAKGTVAARAPIASDAAAAVDALFAPTPVETPTAALAVVDVAPLTREDGPTTSATLSPGGPTTSVPWAAATTLTAAAVASLCVVAGVSFELIAVDNLTKNRDEPSDQATVKRRTQAAVDAERLEIASFVAAGVAGAVAATSAALWVLE